MVWYGNAYGSILKSILSLNQEDKKSTEEDKSNVDNTKVNNEDNENDLEAKTDLNDKDEKNGLWGFFHNLSFFLFHFE